MNAVPAIRPTHLELCALVASLRAYRQSLAEHVNSQVLTRSDVGALDEILHNDRLIGVHLAHCGGCGDRYKGRDR